MATKKAAKKTRTINQRFTTLERLVRFEFRGLHKQMDERFAVMEDRIDRLASHVDGFMKLHETLDIEVRVMKEQMNRFEERLKRIELARTS
jgi:CO dehydrogenase/acetyl-CoA synthase beta subunit